MAERLHDLKQTTNSFQVRGKVTGTKSKRFYTNGTGKNGGAWNVVEFGVEIEEHKTVYVKLNGYTRDSVFYYKKGENGAKGITQKVAWKDRKKAPGKDFRLIGVNITTGKDDNGNNINSTFTEFDAVEWLHEHLSDGDSVFIRGNMIFTSYVDRNGQPHKKTELAPTQISATQKPVDFNAEDYVEMAEFENTLVFSAIEKEEDENSKPTGRFILSGYSVGYNTVEPVSFIIDADHAGVANAIRKKMKPGNSILTYGRISVVNNVEEVEDDGWGSTERSPMERVNAPSVREYIVYKVNGKTFDQETYTEKAIADAIKKIKAAKDAAENFGEKPSTGVGDDADDWNVDDDEDEDSPW